MRLAVLSDIHSNLVALDAVLAAVGSVDGIRVLGDIVGYGPEPDGVVERLQAVGATGVLGNHDQVAVGRLGAEMFNHDARTAIEWTRDRIAATTREWLAALPDRLVEGSFTLVHGSPRDPTWEYILDERTAEENLAAFDTPWCLFGHTHLPIAFRVAGRGVVGGAPAADDRLRLDTRRALLNPGSVGQPRDGDPDSAWAILDTDAGTITWQRTAYDVGATQRAMMLAGLPPRLIVRLSVGAEAAAADRDGPFRPAPEAMKGVVALPGAPDPAQPKAKPADRDPVIPGRRAGARQEGSLFGPPSTRPERTVVSRAVARSELDR